MQIIRVVSICKARTSHIPWYITYEGEQKVENTLARPYRHLILKGQFLKTIFWITFIYPSWNLDPLLSYTQFVNQMFMCV